MTMKNKVLSGIKLGLSITALILTSTLFAVQSNAAHAYQKASSGSAQQAHKNEQIGFVYRDPAGRCFVHLKDAQGMSHFAPAIDSKNCFNQAQADKHLRQTGGSVIYKDGQRVVAYPQQHNYIEKVGVAVRDWRKHCYVLLQKTGAKTHPIRFRSKNECL